MTPETAETAATAGSAGALLRAAREKQGLHIAALAAALKVSPRKLEALEADRHHELDGAVFTRALAQSVCRALRVDAKPVLARLPQPDATTLTPSGGALNMPYKDRASRDERPLIGTAQRVLVAGAVLLMVAAVALFAVPLPWWQSGPVASSAPTSSAASAPSQVITSQVPLEQAPTTLTPVSPASAVLAEAPPATANASTAAPPAASGGNVPSPSPSPLPTGGALRIETSAASWVEVREAGGRVLISRLLSAGEVLSLDAAMPAQLTVGNAASTRVSLRGQAVDLTANNTSNVARIELR